MCGAIAIRFRRWAHALALVALAVTTNSCSRAVKLSVLDPAQLVATPPAGGEAHSSRVARRDSVATLDDGLLVVAGDSILVYARAAPAAPSLKVPQPGSYRLKRMARSIRVMGFVPAGLHWRPWAGSMAVKDNSLEFVSPETRAQGLRRGAAAETLTVPARAISRVDLDEPDVVHTVVLATLIAAAVLALVAWGYAASYQ